MFCDAVIIVGGDFNQLNTTFLESDHGLVQMVNCPTHCGHVIDKIFVSRPDLFRCSVFTSIIKTKHSAVLLTNVEERCQVPLSCRRKKVKLYDLLEHNIDRLRYYLGVYPWGYFLQSNDVEYIYLHFVDIVLHILSECVPAKTAVLGPKIHSMLLRW